MGVAVDVVGQFLLVTNNTANTVTVFSISPSTGALSFVGTSGAGGGPAGVAVDQFGQFVYVANNTGATVSSFSISPTGVLTPITVTPVGAAPLGANVDLSGRFLYIADSGGPSAPGFTIAPATGALTVAPGSPFVTGAFPVTVVVTP
jgi:6-phosphogluconolactonase (cycloisomerase 2 family)